MSSSLLGKLASPFLCYKHISSRYIIMCTNTVTIYFSILLQFLLSSIAVVDVRSHLCVLLQLTGITSTSPLSCSSPLISLRGDPVVDADVQPEPSRIYCTEPWHAIDLYIYANHAHNKFKYIDHAHNLWLPARRSVLEHFL